MTSVYSKCYWDICFIYYWRMTPHVLYMCVRGYQFYFHYRRSHVLYMCVRGYQFYLLSPRHTCTVHVT